MAKGTRISHMEMISMPSGASTAPVDRTMPDRAKVTLNSASDHSTV